MRRIVLEQNEVISLSEVDNRSFVGIQWESGSRSMLISTPEGYCGLSNQYRPNIMNVWHADSIQEYIERALKQGNNTNSRAYAFNNTKELCEWMSK